MPNEVIASPQVKGLETIGATSLTVRIETKVAPGCFQEVRRTLNRMLAEGFTAHHLEIPYPKSVKIEFEPKPAPASDGARELGTTDLQLSPDRRPRGTIPIPG